MGNERNYNPDYKKGKTKVDFHMHSLGSFDGVHTIDFLVHRAKENNVEYLAVTDHNYISYLAQYLVKKGMKLGQAVYDIDGVKLVPGVEVTCRLKDVRNYKGNPCKMHLLVLAPDLSPNSPFVRLMDIKHKNDVVVDYGLLLGIFNVKGVELSEAKVRKYIDEKRIFDPGFSTMDRDDTYEFIMQEYPDMFKSKREFTEVYMMLPRATRINMDVEDVIKVAGYAGGITSVAHPSSSFTHRTNYERDVYPSLIRKGIDGFEIGCNGINDRTLTLIKDAIKTTRSRNPILFTAGSDFHSYGKGQEIGELRDGTELSRSDYGPLIKAIEDRQKIIMGDKTIQCRVRPQLNLQDVNDIVDKYARLAERDNVIPFDYTLFNTPYPDKEFIEKQQ